MAIASWLSPVTSALPICLWRQGPEGLWRIGPPSCPSLVEARSEQKNAWQVSKEWSGKLGKKVSNTVDECLQRQIAQNIFKLKIKAHWHPVNACHYMAFRHHISFVTDLAANFGCNGFRITPDIVSKLSRAAMESSCAVWFKSEQMPFPKTGCRFRPAALHRIRLGTCCFVPMYSETNDW